MRMPSDSITKGMAPADFARPFVGCKPEDRRAHRRLYCRGLVEIRFPAQSARVTGFLRNLSMAGCCIDVNDAVPEGEDLTVEVCLSVNRVRMLVAGQVRYVNKKNRVGIAFTQVTERRAEEIRQLVREVARRSLGLA